MSIATLLEWQKLQKLSHIVPSIPMLFSADNQRTEKFSIELNDIFFDYSKQLINQEVEKGLLDLANSRQLSQAIKNLLTGKIVNPTENRPALHTALRLPRDKKLIVNGINVVNQVHATLDKMAGMIERIHKSQWKGYTGKAITDVVNIGVGGSDLGPLMVVDTLKAWKKGLVNTHFVSNMDGTQLNELLKILNPETTLFIICTKSFTTADTFANVNTALSWLSSRLSERLATEVSTESLKKNHIVGVSSKPDKMSDWGIPDSNQLLLWDWVGGRYSFWSAVGFSIALALGMDTFYEILAGAHEIDEHFATAEPSQNIPVLLGLIGVWNSSFLSMSTHIVLPYDARLRHFPDYLTQLEMESNGKHTTLDDELITDYHTCPLLWGDVGSNGQHAFYQLLHQGTEKVSCDFVATIHRYQNSNSKGAADQQEKFAKMHQTSLANCLAQSRVLAFGNSVLDIESNSKKNKEDNPHKDYPGNHPSTTMLFDELSPRMLGKLIALYEHKVFVMATIWNINPFDQWGVELGKVMANQVDEAIDNKELSSFDTSTNELLRRISGY